MRRLAWMRFFATTTGVKAEYLRTATAKARLKIPLDEIKADRSDARKTRKERRGVMVRSPVIRHPSSNRNDGKLKPLQSCLMNGVVSRKRMRPRSECNTSFGGAYTDGAFSPSRQTASPRRCGRCRESCGRRSALLHYAPIRMLRGNTTRPQGRRVPRPTCAHARRKDAGN